MSVYRKAEEAQDAYLRQSIPVLEALCKDFMTLYPFQENSQRRL